jgi:hypothetical protein
MPLLQRDKKDEVEDNTDLRKILDACTAYANESGWCSAYRDIMNTDVLKGTKYIVGYDNEEIRCIMVNENGSPENPDLEKVLNAITRVARKEGYLVALKRAIENLKDDLSVDITFEKVQEITVHLPPMHIKPAEGEIATQTDNWGDTFTTVDDEFKEKLTGSTEGALRFLLERGVTLDANRILFGYETEEEVKIEPKG